MIRTYQAELVKLARRKVLLAHRSRRHRLLGRWRGHRPRRGQTGRRDGTRSGAVAGAARRRRRGHRGLPHRGLVRRHLPVRRVRRRRSRPSSPRGTIRTMLLRQPRRVRLLAGKLAATADLRRNCPRRHRGRHLGRGPHPGPRQGVDTGAWTTLDAAGAAFTDFGAVLLWITGYAVLGMMVAVLLRSVPLALGVGIAWAGPFEHLVQNAWAPAVKVFPGLLLEAFVAGGTPDITAAGPSPRSPSTP